MNEMKPWMQDDQIKLIEKILTSFKKDHIDILEWGSGGSTVYFTDAMKRRNVKYKWLSIEHHKGWFKKISILMQHDSGVKLFLFPQSKRNPQSFNFDQYVSYPRIHGHETGFSKFDFILIDGRARARCLVEAKFLLNPEGIIVLHDAERARYHYAFKLFKQGKMIKSKYTESSLWITGNF